MDPQHAFCPNLDCPARGQAGQGTIRVHSQQERRYRCTVCGHTFAATRGTPLFRLQSPTELVLVVLSLLSWGCPVQAVVHTFLLDERTVAAWLQRAGQHCQQVHQHLVQQGQVDLQHVQADELWVKLVGQRMWQAMALELPSRLWLGGVVSTQRDTTLILALVQQVRACASCLAILVCVDGLARYVTAFGRAFRTPVHTGRRGRPRLMPAAGFLLGQVIKQQLSRRVVGVAHRAVRGSLEQVERRLAATGGGKVINTAFIERLNATFRSRLAPLIRRGRCLARQTASLRAGMYLVGCCYNFCTYHDRLRLPGEAGGRKWRQRTPAMAAGLTQHRWTVSELLHYRIPPALDPPPKQHRRRTRPSPRPAEPFPLPAITLCSSTV